MKKSFELIKERAALVEAQKRLHETAEKETRSLNEAETKEFREMQGKIEALNEKIKDAEAYEENLRMMAGGAPSVMETGESEKREKEKMLESYSVHKALRSTLRGTGRLELSGIEKEFHDEAVRSAKREGTEVKGVGVPVEFAQKRNAEKRADGQTVTQDSGAYGGKLVATEQRELIEFLRPQPVVEKLGARYLTGLVGNLEFPVNNGGISASWAGEVSAATRSKNEYITKESKPKRLTASTLISLQNLMQSTPDLEKLTRDEINAVVSLKLDETVINGTGVGNVPMGILNAAGVQVVSSGVDGDAPSWTQLVNAAVKVRAANAILPGSKFGWLINPETSGKLETTQKVTGQAIFLRGDDGKINSYSATESTLMPNNLTKGTGTNLSAAIFGDWNQVLINQWGWYDLTLDEVTLKEEGYIKIILNMFADVLVRQPKAFTVVKDWVTV